MPSFYPLKWYIGADRWYLQELTTDEMVCPKRGSDWYNSGEYYRLHYHTWSPDDRFVVNTYDGTTGGISRALEAKADLEGVDYNAIGLSDAVKADHINQLNAITAYFYMKGLDYFGGMPIYHSVNDGLRPRNTALETFRHVETLLKNAIPALAKKSSLGAPEDGYIKQAAAAALLAQLYFNAVAYIGEEHFDECAEICRDIIGGLYGVYELDDTWYGPHTFDNDSSHEAIWNVPSENSKVEWSWYFKYFLPLFVLCLFRHRNRRLQRLHPDAFAQPAGELLPSGSWAAPTGNSTTRTCVKSPYRYLGNKRYEGMFLVGKQVNFDDPAKVCLGQKVQRQSHRHGGSGGPLLGGGQQIRLGGRTDSTMADGEENSGIRLVKSRSPTLRTSCCAGIPTVRSSACRRSITCWPNANCAPGTRKRPPS